MPHGDCFSPLFRCDPGLALGQDIAEVGKADFLGIDLRPLGNADPAVSNQAVANKIQ